MRREASRHCPSPIPTQEACSPSRHPIEGRTGRVEPRAGPSGLGPLPPTPPAAPPRLPGLRGAARREEGPTQLIWPRQSRPGAPSTTSDSGQARCARDTFL